jgi:hypothetical protein
MHVFERGIDESVVVGDVIVRVVEILSDHEVRVAISSPDGSPRYQEVILRTEGSGDRDVSSRKSIMAANC